MGATNSHPMPKLPSSRTVIVTGGNTGIGYETAKAIAGMGARVIIACRSEKRAKEAIERMQNEHNQSIKETKHGSEVDSSTAETAGDKEHERELDSSHQLLVEYMHLDLGSLSSAMEFVKAFKQTGYPLHVLICNAGIAFANQAMTVDGFESQFQVNYLSHLLLVINLLPVIKQSLPDVRIIFVSSRMERYAEFNLENIQGQLRFDRSGFYANSKLYQIMTMFYLHRHLASQGITVCALHPGLVNSEVSRSFDDYTWVKYGFRMCNALGLTRTPKQGAVTTINCAVNPELAGISGIYYINCSSKEPSSRLARNEKEQEKLWKYSMECLKDYIDENVLFEYRLIVTNREKTQAQIAPKS